jgi:hypothetical protein
VVVICNVCKQDEVQTHRASAVCRIMLALTEPVLVSDANSGLRARMDYPVPGSAACARKGAEGLKALQLGIRTDLTLELQGNDVTWVALFVEVTNSRSLHLSRQCG